MKITIKDIARLSEVSTTTVSKILNNKIDDISDETVLKVKRVIKENKYTPNYIARSMVTKKTKTIGLIIPDIRNPFFTEVVKGAEDKANEMDYNIFFCNSDENLDKEIKYIRNLIEKQVDGIVVAGTAIRDKKKEIALNIEMPIITVDRNVYFKEIKASIEIDNSKGAYEATKHIIESGYKEIMFISGPLDIKPSIDRMKGYKKALEEENIIYKAENVIVGTYERNFGYETIKKINKDIKNTGIFCGNDMIAIGLIKGLLEKEYRVPEEVGIVGFDDVYLSSLITPSLTTVYQPSYQMGYKSVEVLLNIINNNKYKKKYMLKTRLIKRESTR